MSMTTPIVDFVRRYAQSGTSRLHMPGHKGQSLLGFEPWDITEIKGADELYGADGIIAQSEANATRLFGTVHTYYSTEGSSQCIRAMLCLALQAAPAAGQRPVLLAARNAHKALLYAAALLDFDIQWLWPAPQDAGALCSCPVSAAKLTGALQGLAQQGKRPFGVYITSPDYLGGVQDIAALAEVCRDFDVPLLVDNAHGAYLRFLPQGGQHPIALGAAMCCDSGHKTLPVVTGGAYLHLGKNAPVQDEAAVRNALALFGSTSPSYLILQSLDKCNQILSEGYPLRLLQCCGHLTRLRRELNEVSAAKHCPGPLALESEPLKVTLDAAVLGLSGTELAEKLRAAKIECEYADPRYLVLMFTPDNPPQDFERLSAAVLRIAEELAGPVTLPEETAGEFAELERGLHRRCTIRQAVFAPQEQLPAEQAVGRICAMPTVSCPPAIPIVVSGEQITPAAAAWMKRYHVEEVSAIREPQ
ncbi:MAG: amino acid decarboxylase [Faecalibacterium sp.]